MSNKELLALDCKPIVTKKIEKKDYVFKFDILHFSSPIYRRKFRYLKALIEVEYKPLEQIRKCFILKGWSADCFKKKMRFGFRATGTSSFPYKKRYIIKVPCDLVKEEQRLMFNIEIYTNLARGKADTLEFQVKHRLDE